MTEPVEGGIDHEQVRRFYDQEYYSSSDSPGPLPWQMRRIADGMGELTGRKVLDVACGTGAWLYELASRGANPSGIDISRRAVERCRLRVPVADVREGVAEQLPFVDGSFDVVTCLGSLEHFLDQPRALCELRRVAKPGGTVLVLVPNSGFLTRRLGLYGGTGQVAIRETVRSIAEWTAMFEQAGLDVCERWRDLHPLSWQWISMGPLRARPLRLLQALALPLWPLRWQYQVYFKCRPRP
jgi:SAM-dependent methyltransferase